MKPILFELPIFGMHLALPTYGTLLAAAFLAALWFSMREARKASIAPEAMMDLWIAALISGIVGAKALLYLLDINLYLSNPRAVLTYFLHPVDNWRSILAGLRVAGVFYGGLIAALIVCVLIVRRRGLPGWKIADITAPAIALGQAIGRLGCFAAGCCYGKPTDLPWAVTFTDPAAYQITGVPLHVPMHPTQLYHFVADLALFAVLLVLLRRKRFDGQVFLWYVILYAVERGLLEMTRGDPRGEIAGLSTSQVIAIAGGLIAAVFLVRRSRSAAARGR